MAITRAQQVKQMLREGGRIGFKGGADAATESFGKSVGYSGPDGSTGRPDKDFNPGTGGGGPTFDDVKASQLSEDQIKREKEYRNFIQAFNKKPPFVGPTASFLRNLIPGNTKLRGQFINQKLQNERIKDFYENLSDDEKNNFEVMQALNAVGYDQYAADMGSPGLLYSGNVGNLEKFVTGEDAFGNTTYGYKEKTGDGDGMSDYERRLLELEQATRALSSMNQEPGEEGGLRLAFRANGGRIGFRGGDAARSDAASGRNAGRADPSGGVERPGGGGGNNNQQTVTAPVNIPKPVKNAINLGGDVSYLKNLIELNPVGIMKNIGGKLIMDKIFGDQTSLDTEDDNNMLLADALTTPTADTMGLNLMDRKTLKDAGYSNSQIQELQDNPNINTQDVIRDIKGPIFAAADGGRIGAAEGGIMDLETGRQMYFLGKLVKKATRAVKKIAKSPIGKAALLYAGTAGLGAFGAGAARAGTGFGIFSPTNVLSNLGASKALLTNKLFGDAVAPNMTKGGGIFSKALKLVRDNPFEAITAASLVAGLTAEQEDQAQQLADTTGIDIEAARNQILNAAKNQDDFRARAFKADGGIMRLGYQEGSKEPVAKKTMPLLDMGGKEMDLREDGGFVPIGRMEKADDVPARLSKNEFVFTADAVRNAGDGNVDKGAEVMYNMMKNLESGGDVSEESQGLEGARKMFQTSQRLEEVI
jgi:hypothetical protein